VNRRQRCEQGYTLIELVVVMALIAIMLAISVPRFRSALVSDQLMYSSRRLVGMIQEVRGKAVREYSDYRLCFDLENRRVWYAREGGGEEQGEAVETFQLPGGVGIKDVLAGGEGRPDGGAPFVSVSRKGYASPSAIHLAEENGRTVTLFVSPFLARVRIADGYQAMEEAR